MRLQRFLFYLLTSSLSTVPQCSVVAFVVSSTSFIVFFFLNSESTLFSFITFVKILVEVTHLKQVQHCSSVIT